MRKKICPLEKEVVACLEAEKPKPEIKKHISECAYCKEVAAVYNWMNEFKIKSWNTEILNKILPNLETIWNRGHLLGMPDKRLVKKALRPLIYSHALSYGVFLAGIIFLIISNIDRIKIIINSKLIALAFPIFLMLMAIVLISTLFCAFAAAFENRK